MKVYNTLYDWQKMFVDNQPREYFEFKFSKEQAMNALGVAYNEVVQENKKIDKVGYFLRMGTGKTKITVAKAEKNNADCVFVTTLRSKVIAGEEPGEFGDELKLAGYKVFYAHKAFDNQGELNILSLDSKRIWAEFEASIKNKDKIAYIFNHEHVTTKKGYERLVTLALNYNNISWIIDEAHKISNKSAEISKRIYDMIYKFSTPNIKIKLRQLKSDLKNAKEQNNWNEVVRLENLEKLNKENIFRKSITGFYLATGTPNANGYVSLYWLLRLLGHNWTYVGPVVSDGEVVHKIIKDYNAFFEEFCIEDTWVKKFNPYAKAIKAYKNIDKLLDITQQFAFFAKTANYFAGMPSRLVETVWIPKHETYTQMTDSNKNNPYYRVLDGFIADSPAILRLRARQLASGFMGNAEESNFYHEHKVEALKEMLQENEDNYLIFYNYTPELTLIKQAATEAGYNIDIYNGIEKSLDNYRAAESEDTKNVIISNVASGSAGLNLQKFNKVIFFALPDTFKDYDQAIGRIERIGQKAKEITVINFITKGTVEEDVWKSLKVGEDYTIKMYMRDIIWREL